MKKITDERLIVRNLKNIRICFLIENFAIMGILVYQMITTGKVLAVLSLRNVPFLILMAGFFPMLVLSLNVSVPMRDEDRVQMSKFAFAGLVVFAVNTILFYFIFPVHSLLLALGCGALSGVIAFVIFAFSNKYRN